MICLGLDDAEKEAEVARYVAEHAIRKVVVLSPEKFTPGIAVGVPHEQVEWEEIQMYRTFYRLMQEVDGGTLVVVNEGLRTQNRHDLNYNCIRNFLNQTPHVLVFQYMPIIDTWDDFATLFDFETQSRWKREKVGHELLRQARIQVAPVHLELHAVPVAVDDKVRAAYAKEKAALLAEVRSDPGKDPHLIPRNLLLVGGQAKLAHVDPVCTYVGRNNRLKIPGLVTYKEPACPVGPCTVLELPHSFLDFADFLTLSRHARGSGIEVLVADLPVERWYFDRYQAWAWRIREAYALLRAGGAVEGIGGGGA